MCQIQDIRALTTGTCGSTKRPVKRLVLGLFLAGCAPASAPPPVTAGTVAVTAASGGEVLPFLHDDYPKALAAARARKKPLFVDAWAPWCHSCQSLRTYVLTDPVLAPLKDELVWLSVDTEKDTNAAWVAKYPHAALPTLWVIDPVTEKATLKWAGTVTAEELKALLAVATGPASGEGIAATEAFVRGNHALAAGDTALATQEHRAALAAAPRNHPQRARIVEALVTELSLAKRPADCATVAAAEAPDLQRGTSRASTVVTGLSCAREAKMTGETERLFSVGLADASARDRTLLPDDRSAVYEELVATKTESGDKQGALLLARAWSSFVDEEAAHAATKDARTSLDPNRLGAYLAAKEPAKAIPMLEASEKDFPADYNPPARLARVYIELGRLAEADQAADRAIERVYGPRSLRVHALKADIAKARGDTRAEAAALEAALKKADPSQLTEGQKMVREALVKRLNALK